jgi:hypothetical protein
MPAHNRASATREEQASRQPLAKPAPDELRSSGSAAPGLSLRRAKQKLAVGRQARPVFVPSGRLTQMSRRTRLVLLMALIFADAWIALTVINAVTRSGGQGGVFWSAVGLLVALGAALLWLTVRVARTPSRR